MSGWRHQGSPSWEISDDGAGIRLACGASRIWDGAVTEVVPADGPVLVPVRGSGSPDGWIWEYAAGLSVRHGFSVDGGWFRVTTEVRNAGASPVRLREVRIFSGQLAGPVWERIFTQTSSMTGRIGIFPCSGSFASDACAGWTDAAGTRALVLGFEKLDTAFFRIEAEASADAVRVAAVCLREEIPLAPGGVLEISPLLVGAGGSLAGLLESYAVRAARALGGARPARETMTGWCSWYHYYGQESAGEILANARALAESPLRGKLRVIQIDDGWNLPSRGQPRAWGDWFPGDKFPQGMEPVVDELHDLGFQAGLWLAPFSVDIGSRLAAEHPDWIVRVRNAETGLLDPAGPGHVFGLDLTHPAVLDWLRETFQRVFDTWRFDYIKIDFLIHGVLPGVRQDPAMTTAEAFRRGLQVIRECAGEDRFILNCGSPLGPSIGLCDGMRIGPDVGGRWFAPMNLDQWPHGNCCIRAAAYPSLFRQWMHGIWWQNDPDCLIVRDGMVPCERDMMARIKERMHAPELGLDDADFGLSQDEAEFWVRAVWMTGGMDIVSEVWSGLRPERQSLLRRAFPPHSHPVGWIDCYEFPDVCVLQSRSGPAMVGLFNLSDETRRIRVQRGRLRGGPERCEWLTGETFRLDETMVDFPELPPRSARIWVENGMDAP